MALILCIETSTHVSSVAVHQNGKLLGLIENHRSNSHSEILLNQINYCINQVGISLTSLDAIAVSKGPGSYTGLRIGAATAKGLCYGLNKPLIGIETLDTMAFHVNQFNNDKSLVCPMIDARRMEVYCSVFDDINHKLLPTEAKILTEDSFREFSDVKKMLYFGNGAEKFRDLMKDSKFFIYLEGIYPSAKYLGVLAEDAFQTESFVDSAYYEPYYLKEFVTTHQ